MTTTYGTCTTMDLCPICGGSGQSHGSYREQRGANSRWYGYVVDCQRCTGTGQVEVTIDLDVDDDAVAAA
ncbi:MAG: hypothetical protein H0U40_04330 [Chloroflexia bacterium]|nr:hypothetical protein [Chloroflexia bacterium]